ncbi:PHD finger protein 3 [Boothiomyces macroporosus]|uniref:Transcription factor BYE1 n=1 Tax=Boothiomyces macroporosus TaxID=261099 RepID=A0AAD5UMG5_9FUNG|nr:PHD finger protein 3 [Boothiomyces macroporosus]
MSRTKRKRVRQTVKEYNIKGQQIYCLCRQVDDGSFMIQCDDCKEWFHGNCVGIQEETAPDTFSCILCIQFANSEASEATAVGPAAITPTVKPPETETKEPEQKKQKVEAEKMDKTEKLRKLAKKGFQETFKLLFQQLKDDPNYLDLPVDRAIDLDAPLSFAQDLEEALFAQYSVENQDEWVVTDQYKVKFRSLQFNLKDPKNKRLKRRLFCLKETMEKVVQLSPEEMANDDVVLKAEEIARESLHMAYKPSDSFANVEETRINTEQPLMVTNVSLPETDLQKAIVNTAPIMSSTPNIPPPEVKSFAPKVKPVVAPKVQRDSLDSLLERMNAPIYQPPKIESENNKFDSSQTISSVQEQPKQRESKEKVIWKGILKMPQVTEVEVYGYQIAGKQLSASTWKGLLSSNMLIGGRIPISKTMDYLNQRIQQKTEISVLQLDSKDSKHYQKLAIYLLQKERYGVIADPLPGIKDLYLIPIKRQETHSLFQDLRCRYKINNEKDSLVLVAVMGAMNKKVEKKPQETPTPYQPPTSVHPIPSNVPQMYPHMQVPMQAPLPNAFQNYPYPAMNTFNIPTFNPNMNPPNPQFANPGFNLNNVNPQSFQGLLDGLGLQSQQIGGLLADLLSKQNN